MMQLTAMPTDLSMYRQSKIEEIPIRDLNAIQPV
jgi:hypothetical protein